MQVGNNKPSVIFISIGAVLSLYAGYLFSGAWREGMDINSFLQSMPKVINKPFAWYFCRNTPKCMVMALIIYLMFVLMYYTSRRNFMPGKEFGTAKFDSPNMVNKIVMDNDEGFNRILSQNMKMSLNFRKLKLNGNVLICGGSGAGKTFYVVKPNLMQMPHNCSFICTDPKGGAERSAMKSSGTVLLNY